MSQPVRFDLQLKYTLSEKEATAILEGVRQNGIQVSPPQSLEEWSRGLSERLITYAVEKMYGQELPRADQIIYRPILRQLQAGAEVLELDSTQWTWFANLFTGSRSVEKVQFPSIWAEWSGQFMDQVEEYREGQKALAAGA